MICQRCGWCCMNLLAIVVKDPNRGVVEDNLLSIGLNGPERCPHLQGDEISEYSCAIHSKRYYKKLGCADYQSHWPDQKCRMGEFLKKEAEREDRVSVRGGTEGESPSSGD
jgi:hypothetical protein